MTTERRIRALEDRAAPAAEPVQFAMFDRAGRPLNALARRLGKPTGPTFTIKIDRRGDEEGGDGAA